MKTTVSLKALALLPLLGAAISSAQAASPLINLGEDAFAYFVCDMGLTYNDNILYNTSKVDDVIFTLSPGIVAEFGKESNNHFTLSARERFLAYMDHDALNTQLASVDAGYTYDAQSRLRATLAGSFAQSAQNDNTATAALGIIKRDYYNGLVDLSYSPTDKSSIDVGFQYRNEHFTNYRNRYNDRQTYSIPVSWFYNVAEKLSVGLSYTYSYTGLDKNGLQKDPTNGQYGNDPGNQVTHFGGLSLRGSLTEKISVRANAGIGYQSFEDRVGLGGDTSSSTFNFSVAAEYQPSQWVHASLTAGRRFDVGAAAQGITNTFFRLGGSYRLASHWQSNAYVGYSYQDFERAYGRRDKILNAGVGISFIPNSIWSVSLSYDFTDVDSNVSWGQYSVNQVSLTATLRY